jgi:hypothetical protein
MAKLLLLAGASIFAILGIVHAWYTFSDSRDPRWLVPNNRATLAAMQAAGLRISGARTTVWDAWLGFNYSHALGLLMFATGGIALALSLTSLAPATSVLLVPVAIALAYFGLALRYWFKVPAIGVAIGALCFFGAWLAY